MPRTVLGEIKLKTHSADTLVEFGSKVSKARKHWEGGVRKEQKGGMGQLRRKEREGSSKNQSGKADRLQKTRVGAQKGGRAKGKDMFTRKKGGFKSKGKSRSGKRKNTEKLGGGVCFELVRVQKSNPESPQERSAVGRNTGRLGFLEETIREKKRQSRRFKKV